MNNLELVINQTEKQLDDAKIDNGWMPWVCPKMCGFERYVRLIDLLADPACPKCSLGETR